MSITDGQWILDMEIFRSGVRPALSIGLSVTRAGGVGHNKRQKDLAARTLKLLADYRQAEEFSHFGSELADEAKRALIVGRKIFEVLTQSPTDTYSLMCQQLMLDIVLNMDASDNIDTNALKMNVHEFAKQITAEEQFDAVRDQLKIKCIVAVAGAQPAAAPAAQPQTEQTPTAPVEPPKEAEKPAGHFGHKNKDKEKAEAKS